MELNLKTQQNKLISLFRVSLMFFLFFFVQQTVASSQSITLPSHCHPTTSQSKMLSPK